MLTLYLCDHVIQKHNSTEKVFPCNPATALNLKKILKLKTAFDSGAHCLNHLKSRILLYNGYTVYRHFFNKNIFQVRNIQKQQQGFKLITAITACF